MSAPAQPVDAFELWNANQSLWFEQIWRIHGETVRVVIRRNAYDDQSIARCDIYARLARQWNELCSIPISALDCAGLSYVMDSAENQVVDAMAASCMALVRKATMILATANIDRA